MRMVPRRPDWLAELHGLLAIAVALTGIGAAVTTLAILTGQAVDVEVSSDVLRDDALADVPPGATVASGILLHIDHPTAAQRGWELLATLPHLLLLGLVLTLLWRLVRRAAREDPFTASVVGRIRTLGLLLAVGGPVVWVLEFVGAFALSLTLNPDETYAALDFAVPGAWVLCGFGVFAVGEIIRRGRALRVELDGVV